MVTMELSVDMKVWILCVTKEMLKSCCKERKKRASRSEGALYTQIHQQTHHFVIHEHSAVIRPQLSDSYGRSEEV